MATQQNEGLSARSYLGVGLRWKWLILAVTVMIALAGAAYAWTRTPMYSATAQLLYVQQIGINNSFGQGQVDQTLQQADIGSVPAVVSSAVVGAQAGRLLNGINTSAGYSTSVSLTTDTSTSGYSSVVGIAAASSDPRTAAAAANAYAAAFIAWRRDSERARVNQENPRGAEPAQTYTTPTQRSQRRLPHLATEPAESAAEPEECRPATSASSHRRRCPRRRSRPARPARCSSP